MQIGIFCIWLIVGIQIIIVEGFFPRKFLLKRPYPLPTTGLKLEMTSSDSKKFCVNVTCYVKAERRDEFIKVVQQNAAGTHKEPLNVQYVWGENIYTPNIFHFQEQFTSKEGFEAHTRTEHFAVWAKFATDPLTDPNSPFMKPVDVIQFEENS